MKIPVEWLKQYIDTKKSAKELAESFTSLGLLLDKPIYTYTNGKFQTEVLDLEHRMDRADWLSITGCACDLAAFENIKLKLPELKTKEAKKLSESDRIKIEVKCPEFVNRFNTRIFKGIKVKPSPDWLKNSLESYGLPSINNVVDITNFVMVELGQPMHAQDINKLEKPEIVIRKAKNGEKITTLLGETVELYDGCFVLTQNDQPTVIGGIVGGVATGIDESTTEIILDAGNYNQTAIRKASRKLKIQNETVMRYDKFLHPDLTEVALNRATNLILEIAGGEYYENFDWYPKKFELKKLKLTYDRLKLIGGLEIEKDYVKNVLESLEYKVSAETKTGLEVEVPFFRTDVEVEDDLISDVLRIYGYSNIPIQALTGAPPEDITPKIYLFEDRLRQICMNLGLHEHITDPLVMTDSSQKKQVILENSQSQLKNALRTNIYDGLKTVTRQYFKHQKESTELFEIGKVYSKISTTGTLEDYKETRITQVYVGNQNTTTVENSIAIRKILSGLFVGVGVTDYKLEAQTKSRSKIVVGDKESGFLEWDQFVLHNEVLLAFWTQPKRVVTEFKSEKMIDLSIVVSLETKLGEVVAAIKSIDKNVNGVEVQIQNFKNEDKENKYVLLKIGHTSDDYEKLRKEVVDLITKKFSAKIR